MDRELCKRLLDNGVLKAFSEGKTLQYFDSGKWEDFPDDCEPYFNFTDYRIKPEPKYIPFDFDTAVSAKMYNRIIEFRGIYHGFAYLSGKGFSINGFHHDWEESLKFTFADTGSQCGIQVEGLPD